MALLRHIALAGLLLSLALFSVRSAYAEAAAEGEHAAGEHGASEHGEGHHAPSFDDVNWFYGFIGEDADVEPNLLWRKPGMPIPVGVLVLNTGILFFLIYKFGKQPIAKALKDRRAGIVKGIEEAAKMKAEAEASFLAYEQKLQQIDAQIERVRREMREMGEAERERILEEARERRQRMEREAKVLIDQEIKAARERLHREVVENAFRTALTTLEKQVTSADHQRIGQAYITTVAQASAVFSKGGQS